MTARIHLSKAHVTEVEEKLVLDMGEPAKIVEVAQTLVDLSGKTNIDIGFTGLCPGEKLSRGLFAPDEAIPRSSHPLVRHVDAPPISSETVLAQSARSSETTLEWIRAESLAR